MLSKRELREIQLKKENDKSIILTSFIIALYSIYHNGINVLSFLYSFLTFILSVVLFLIIHPFLEEKLQLKKIHRYSGRRKYSILAMITFPPIFLIWYFVNWIYKYFNN